MCVYSYLNIFLPVHFTFFFRVCVCYVFVCLCVPMGGYGRHVRGPGFHQLLSYHGLPYFSKQSFSLSLVFAIWCVTSLKILLSPCPLILGF